MADQPDQREIQRARYNQWKADNIEAFKISSRNSAKKWSKAHPDKEAEKAKRYRAKNKESYNTYMKNYMNKIYEYKKECKRIMNINIEPNLEIESI